MDDPANECSVALDKPPVGCVAVQEFDVDFEVIRRELPMHDGVFFWVTSKELMSALPSTQVPRSL